MGAVGPPNQCDLMQIATADVPVTRSLLPADTPRYLYIKSNMYTINK